MATTSRDPAATPHLTETPRDKAEGALKLMVEALALIDAGEGAGTAGAHLDLAIHRLQEWLDGQEG